ncbi:Aldehyde/histidinol dehydrogenase [Aspergillus novoparasiticus]|uniref:Aldehyde/histidinol dehydrogenase n=1 Tax=Aspergillus novoparasiticus TaxID=986946 RepID=A0A5N6EL74_9EURO|nr:Aldehyde/histidinol dehydrogenase [Aspergillus novoparasiticus]
MRYSEHATYIFNEIRNAVVNTVRGAFEYQRQKCSATSRLYIAESVWPEFKEKLIQETETLKMGGPEQFDNFIGPVIHQRSWEKLNNIIEKAKNKTSVTLLAGEFFGPVLAVHVFPEGKFGEM